MAQTSWGEWRVVNCLWVGVGGGCGLEGGRVAWEGAVREQVGKSICILCLLLLHTAVVIVDKSFTTEISCYYLSLWCQGPQVSIRAKENLYRIEFIKIGEECQLQSDIAFTSVPLNPQGWLTVTEGDYLLTMPILLRSLKMNPWPEQVPPMVSTTISILKSKQQQIPSHQML